MPAALGTGDTEMKSLTPLSQVGETGIVVCAVAHGVNRTREFPMVTVSDIASGPSLTWEDSGMTNTWTLSSRSLESILGVSCSTDSQDYLRVTGKYRILSQREHLCFLEDLHHQLFLGLNSEQRCL